MDADRKERRADAKLAVDTVKELLELGVVPRAVTVGEVRVEGLALTAAAGAASASASVTEPTSSPHRGHLDRLADRMAARRSLRTVDRPD